MVVLSAGIERPWEKLGPEHGDYFSTFENGLKTISLGLTGAFIAIAMVLCEFWLILKSNAIVLMIGGVIKELVTIFVGVTLFGDNLNLINITGIVVVFLGVFLYKATLHLNREEKDVSEESNPNFSRIHSDDLYEDEPPLTSLLNGRMKRKKNSDADLALKFTIEDGDIDEDVLHDMNSDLMRRTNGTSAFELDGREAENRLQII